MENHHHCQKCGDMVNPQFNLCTKCFDLVTVGIPLHIQRQIRTSTIDKIKIEADTWRKIREKIEVSHKEADKATKEMTKSINTFIQEHKKEKN